VSTLLEMPGSPAYAPAAPTTAAPQSAAPTPKGPRKIMFASQKGGVGKTASAVNVGAALGEAGQRVLLVDTDPIGSVAASFGVTLAPGHPGLFGLDQWELGDLTIPEIGPNLDLLPYAEDRRPVDLNALHRSLANLSRKCGSTYDYIVVDTRPSVADMTRRLCQVVDEVVVVFQCHPLAYRTLGGILGQLRDARSDGAAARLVGLLLTMVDQTDEMQAQLEGHIRKSLGASLFPVSIPMDPQLDNALMNDRPIVLHSPDSPSAKAYRELALSLVAAGPPESA
jgi:chromosome partitioning protein